MTETMQRGRTAATLLARLILGLVYALAAISKITAPAEFRQEVLAYHILPFGVVGIFATVLPWIEALIALYLLVGLFLRPAAILAALTLVMFIAALSTSLVQGTTAHGCGCFSGSGPLGSLPFVTWLAGGATITPFDVVRDVIFIGLAAIIYWGDRFTLSIDGLLFGPAADPVVDDEEPAPPAQARPPVTAGRRSN